MAFWQRTPHTPRQEHGNPQEIHQARKRLGHIHRRGGGTLTDTSPRHTPPCPFRRFRSGVSRLRIQSGAERFPYISQSFQTNRRLLLGRRGGIYTMDVRLYLLGSVFRRGARHIHLRARPIRVSVDNLRHTVLHISVCVVCQLPSVLRKSGRHAANRGTFGGRNGGKLIRPPETDTRKQDDPDRTQLIMSHTQEQLIAQSIDEWIERKGFTTGGITIADVARDTGTNRTYLSLFVNNRYHTSFREWVNRLRLDYAKEIMSAHPDMPMAEVAQKAGYLSMSYFTKTFKQSEGITPGKWGKN